MRRLILSLAVIVTAACPPSPWLAVAREGRTPPPRPRPRRGPSCGKSPWPSSPSCARARRPRGRCNGADTPAASSASFRRSAADLRGQVRPGQGAAGREGLDAGLLLRQQPVHRLAHRRAAGHRGGLHQRQHSSGGIKGWKEAGQTTETLAARFRQAMRGRRAGEGELGDLGLGAEPNRRAPVTGAPAV